MSWGAEGCEWRQGGAMLNTLYIFCTSLSHLDVLLLQQSDGHEAREDRERVEVDVGGVDHVRGKALWGVRKCGSESNEARDFHRDYWERGEQREIERFRLALWRSPCSSIHSAPCPPLPRSLLGTGGQTEGSCPRNQWRWPGAPGSWCPGPAGVTFGSYM